MIDLIESYLNESGFVGCDAQKFADTTYEFSEKCERYLKRKMKDDVEMLATVNEGNRFAKFKYNVGNSKHPQLALVINHDHDYFEVKGGYNIERPSGKNGFTVKEVNEVDNFTQIRRMACRDVFGWALEDLKLNKNNRKFRSKR